jgi:uncharacterized protein
MRRILISNLTNPAAQPINALLCDTFASRLRGLMFQKSLQHSDGIVLAESRESIIDTTIHMLFMNFNIGVLWLDSNKKIVDAKLAKKWRPAYAPSLPARYVLETHPDRLTDYAKDHILAFIDA